MHKLASRVTRIVLCAPLMGLRPLQSGDDKMRRMATALRWLGMGTKYAAGGRIRGERLFENNPLTSDPVRFARNMEVVRNNPDLALAVQPSTGSAMLWGGISDSSTRLL